MNLIQFENKLFTVVARCVKNGKIQKFSEIIVLLHSHSQRFFSNVSLKISNINNRRMTSAHVAILLSFMQLIKEYLFSRTNIGSKTFTCIVEGMGTL